jgi:hypothetical protein
MTIQYQPRQGLRLMGLLAEMTGSAKSIILGAGAVEVGIKEIMFEGAVSGGVVVSEAIGAARVEGIEGVAGIGVIEEEVREDTVVGAEGLNGVALKVDISHTSGNRTSTPAHSSNRLWSWVGAVDAR